MLRRRLALALAPVLALTLGLAACGDDDDGAAPTTTTEAGATTTDGSTTTDGDATAPTTTGEDPGEGSTTTAPGGEGEPGDGDGFCAAFATFNEDSADQADDTVADIQAGVEILVDRSRDMADAAPAELADAADAFAATFVQLRDRVADVGSVEEAEGIARELTSSTDFGRATQQIGSWTEENCAG